MALIDDIAAAKAELQAKEAEKAKAFSATYAGTNQGGDILRLTTEIEAAKSKLWVLEAKLLG